MIVRKLIVVGLYCMDALFVVCVVVLCTSSRYCILNFFQIIFLSCLLILKSVPDRDKRSTLSILGRYGRKFVRLTDPVCLWG